MTISDLGGAVAALKAAVGEVAVSIQNRVNDLVAAHENADSDAVAAAIAEIKSSTDALHALAAPAPETEPSPATAAASASA